MTERTRIEAAIELTLRRRRVRRILDATAFQVACGAMLSLVPAVVGAVCTSVVEAPFVFGLATVGAAIVIGVVPTIRHRDERHEAARAIDRALGDDQDFLTAATIPERDDPWPALHLRRLESKDLEDAARRAGPIAWPRAAPLAVLALISFSIASSLPRHRSSERILIDRLTASITPTSGATTSAEAERFMEELRRARTVEEARKIARAALENHRRADSTDSPTEGTRLFVDAMRKRSADDLAAATERVAREVGISPETDELIAAFLRRIAGSSAAAAGSQELEEAARAARKGDGSGAGASLLTASRAISEALATGTRPPLEEMALTALATLGGDGEVADSSGTKSHEPGRADSGEAPLTAMTSSLPASERRFVERYFRARNARLAGALRR